MQKYYLSLSAILIAICAAAFSTPPKAKPAPFSGVYFEYTGGDYLSTHVQNPDNWVEVTDLETGCNGTNHRACRIAAQFSDTDGSAPFRTLKSGFSIITSTWSGNAFVLNAGSVLQVRNKN